MTVSFTITVEGTVSDVRVIEAAPLEIFDSTSIRAIERFRFEPRVVNGVAVPVSDVQHTFHYSL